jgi:phospholipid/cholesterol/gamma-HCH transport system permease protein
MSEAVPAIPEREEGSLLARLGFLVLTLCHHTGGVVLLLREDLALLLRLRVDAAETLRHLERFAVRSLLVVIGGSAIVGGVVAMQGLGYVARYHATDAFGWAAGVSSFREVAPMLLGLVVASRVGARNTAELSTLVARERLDALTALGLDPRRVVVAPRLFAISISAVLLFPIATTTVLASAFLIAWGVGDQRLAASWSSVIDYMPAGVVLEGLLRMAAFGALIAVASCWFGTRGGHDARAVGRNVYGQSVASFTGIVVINLYLTFLGGA